MAKQKNIPQETEESPSVPMEQKQEDHLSEQRAAFVDKILRKYSSYQSLYIDIQGGTYSAETAANVRGSAVLYQNPYFKS